MRITACAARARRVERLLAVGAQRRPGEQLQAVAGIPVAGAAVEHLPALVQRLAGADQRAIRDGQVFLEGQVVCAGWGGGGDGGDQGWLGGVGRRGAPGGWGRARAPPGWAGGRAPFRLPGSRHSSPACSQSRHSKPANHAARRAVRWLAGSLIRSWQAQHCPGLAILRRPHRLRRRRRPASAGYRRSSPARAPRSRSRLPGRGSGAGTPWRSRVPGPRRMSP